MTEENRSEQNRRRFERHYLNEDVRAVDEHGRDMGRVEKVGAGGMQIRLSEQVAAGQYGPGSRFEISIVEPGNLRNQFKVEVRVRKGDLLGVEFLN
jgi:hypothetical protein